MHRKRSCSFADLVISNERELCKILKENNRHLMKRLFYGISYSTVKYVYSNTADMRILDSPVQYGR